MHDLTYGEALLASNGREWRRSGRCVSEDNCVEVADGDGAVVGLRSSMAPGTVLDIPVANWAAFVDAVKHGTLHRSAAATVRGRVRP